MSSDHKTLAEIVGVEPARPEVVAGCIVLIDAEVKAKRGVKGIAIKGAYRTVKAIKPRMVRDVVEALLDDWLAKMEPYYRDWTSAGSGSFAEFVGERSEDVAEDLLTVTDERAAKTKHKTAGKLYRRLRPSAKVNVASAVPELGALIEGHLDDAAEAAEAAES